MLLKGMLRSLISACVLGISATAAASSLPLALEKSLKQNNLNPDSLSLVAIPLTGSGQPIFHNADRAINPASAMKLVTTYAALELLGPAYQWKTEFYSDGTLSNGVLNGNLYVKGGGDPKLTMERLWLLLRDLKANGVTEVTGDLVLDNQYFTLPQIRAFDDDGDDGNKPFLVEPDSLLVNFKAMRIISLGEQGQVKVSIEPPIENLNVVNQVKLLPAGKCQDPARIAYNTYQSEQQTELVLTGELVSGCRTQAYLALLDHPQYVSGTIRAMWRELGGSIQGQDRIAAVPTTASVVARNYSADLTEVIRDVNKYSNNTMAKQVFLSIGAQHRSAADADDAAAAKRMISQWFKHKNIPDNALVIENGSGLSRSERTSARELGLMLQKAWESPYSAEFISSLPIAGMDGTLRNRMKNTAVRGKAHLKTGTLRNVRALAGYVRDKNNQQWVLVAIVNDDKPWGGAAVIDSAVINLHQNVQ